VPGAGTAAAKGLATCTDSGGRVGFEQRSRLMEQYQQFDPFKFLIYAELAGAEIGPVE
jgi:hypothetical protein